MHCMRCGQPLKKLDRTAILDQQEQKLELWYIHEKGDAPRVDRSDHHACFNAKCGFGNADGTPDDKLLVLHAHHPHRGPNSAPGDSYSLSWIK